MKQRYVLLALLLVAMLSLVAGAGASSPAADAGSTPIIDEATASAPVISLSHGSARALASNGETQTWVNIFGNAADADFDLALLTYRIEDGPEQELLVGPAGAVLPEAGDFKVELPAAALTAGLNQITITATDSLGKTAEAVVMLRLSDGQVQPYLSSLEWNTTDSQIQAIEQEPLISNVNVTPGLDRATFTWTTDQPATSKVVVIGGGNAEDTALKTDHSLTVTGLAPNTPYFYQISSTNADGFTGQTGTNSFQTLAPAEVDSDNFNYCGLAQLESRWDLINPGNDASFSVDGERVTISVPAGESHDIWPGDPGEPINRAPRIMQEANNIDNMVVKFDSNLAESIQVQGIVIEQDDTNILRANFQRQGSGVSLFVIKIVDGAPSIVKNQGVGNSFIQGPMYMRIDRTGDQWIVSYSKDGASWSDLTPFTLALDVTRAGVFAGNSASTPGTEPAHDMIVDFVSGKPPIGPGEDDTTANFLPVSVVGHGTVTKNKQCGNPVTLTAIADDKWTFSKWQGSTVNNVTDPTVEVNFQQGDEVTAVFTTDEPQYDLNIEIINDGDGVGGTVSKSPDYETYLAGDKVTLTAEPALGWSFAGWGGDASGSEKTKIITISGDTNVTATFSQARYTLDVKINGNGTVVKNPDQADYGAGQQVKLTAVPEAGYAFAGWDGGLTGNPTTVTITEDTVVTANFIQSAARPISDDFNTCTLKSFWSFVDPLGDATLQTNGTQASISLPTGQAHSLWQNTYNVARLMQTAEDENFEVEVKFESALSEGYQLQGIVIEQNADNLLRIEFLHDGKNQRVFTASIIDGTAKALGGPNVGGGAPTYLRVGRVGNEWTVSSSSNGTNWSVAKVFTQALTVNRVGVYAGNDKPDANTPAPATTSVIDYFFNNAAPIAPEDGNPTQYTLTTRTSGNGSVNRDKQGPYGCGDRVRLTANPAAGWRFSRWEGDLSGNNNPGTVVIQKNAEVTAVFVPAGQTADYFIYQPMVIRP